MSDSGEKEKRMDAEDIAEIEPMSVVMRTREEMRRMPNLEVHLDDELFKGMCYHSSDWPTKICFP